MTLHEMVDTPRYYIPFIALICILGALSGCDNTPDPIPKWHRGDFVRSVLTNAKGQVVKVYCGVYADRVCEYDVRFANNTSQTDTHVMQSDGPVTNPPVVDVFLEEFELKSE